MRNILSRCEDAHEMSALRVVESPSSPPSVCMAGRVSAEDSREKKGDCALANRVLKSEPLAQPVGCALLTPHQTSDGKKPNFNLEHFHPKCKAFALLFPKMI